MLPLVARWGLLTTPVLLTATASVAATVVVIYITTSVEPQIYVQRGLALDVVIKFIGRDDDVVIRFCLVECLPFITETVNVYNFV